MTTPTTKKTTITKKSKETAAPPVTTTPERKFYKFSDDAIVVIREILQLSIITGTNLVDHLRSVVVEPDETGSRLVPCPEYISSYNTMIEKLAAEATEKMKESLKEETEEDLTKTKN